MDGFGQIVGAAHVLTEKQDMDRYLTDWTGVWTGTAKAVIRPASAQEVSDVLKLARAQGLCVTVQSGNTSLAGGSVPGAAGGIVLSLDRMTRIRAIDPDARTATVDAGAIIQSVQEAVAPYGLDYPLMFGARGSARIGGALASNAGGSNVVRYGNARELCLGLEAVLPNGDILNGLTGLRKDNSGYDLRHLLIGSEGTLGVITGAVLKLVPTPAVRATAFLGVSSLEVTLDVLNRLQDVSGGLVEAFEWMPRDMVEAIAAHKTDTRLPLDPVPETGILLELASTRPSDAIPDSDGAPQLEAVLIKALSELMEQGVITDAMVAKSETQRRQLWAMREAALEALMAHGRFLTLDASLPLSQVAPFVAAANPIAAEYAMRPLCVAHLGDGNVHYATVAAAGHDWDEDRAGRYVERIMDLIAAHTGSFSAEHGIGRSKARILATRKDAGQMAMMRCLKASVDPDNLLGRGVLFADDPRSGALDQD